MKNLHMIGGILIAFFAIQIGNTAFGQSTGTTDTAKCLLYDGTNLKIIDIFYTILTGGAECQKELDRVIGEFHPTGITVSTQDVVLTQGGSHYREDIIYLTK